MKEKALNYHSKGRPGKIAISITKPCNNAEDLSLAYSPGVAYPCLEIKDNPEDAYKYTSKGNLVAVISNGTAVLGLGNIGALASKPVMEGKGVLFKKFADIDVFDIEIDEQDPEKLVEIISKLEPTFGGINLEDIKAPECFYVETELIKKLNIPVFHDDQHGTAVITAAALQNALQIAEKTLEKVKIVVSGAGSAAIAICKLLVDMGVPKVNIFMYDRTGLIISDREDINEYKRIFAQESSDISLADCLKGSDVFIGVSAGNILSKDMVKAMNSKPIIFGLANPNPEILPEDAKEAAPDVIMATGRSDYPNQVNNVLGFPYIFRGALDSGATEINKEMKFAAVQAIAQLAHKPIPQEVVKAYGKKFKFGSDYIIPKPFDPRLLYNVSLSVFEAAVKTGVAKNTDIEGYKKRLSDLTERLSKEV